MKYFTPTLTPTFDATSPTQPNPFLCPSDLFVAGGYGKQSAVKKNNYARQLNGQAAQKVPVMKALEEVIYCDTGVKERALLLEAALEYTQLLDGLFADAEKALKAAQDAMTTTGVHALIAEFQDKIKQPTATATSATATATSAPTPVATAAATAAAIDSGLSYDDLCKQRDILNHSFPAPTTAGNASSMSYDQLCKQREIEDSSCILPNPWVGIEASPVWIPPTGQQLFQPALDALTDAKKTAMAAINKELLGELEAALCAEKKRAMRTMATTLGHQSPCL